MGKGKKGRGKKDKKGLFLYADSAKGVVTIESRDDGLVEQLTCDHGAFADLVNLRTRCGGKFVDPDRIDAAKNHIVVCITDCHDSLIVLEREMGGNHYQDPSVDIKVPYFEGTTDLQAVLQHMFDHWSLQKDMADAGDSSAVLPSRTVAALAFANAADAILENDMWTAGRYTIMGLFVEEWIETEEGRSQGDLLSSWVQEWDDKSPDTTSRKLGAALLKCRTNRGMTLLVHQKLPCECLKKVAKGFKAQPRMESCHCCKKEVELTKVLVCERCNEVKYCSKECQSLQWSLHKRRCKKA